MLNPCGWFVLVKLIPIEEDAGLDKNSPLKAAGFVVKSGMDKFDETRTKVAMERGIVVKLGPLAYKDERKFGPNPEPWCKPGDEVTFGKFAGKVVQDRRTKEEFFLLVDEDIQLVETD